MLLKEPRNSRMSDAALAALSAEQLRTCLLQDENPYGELTQQRYAELVALGIPDPFGYLTNDEWHERALRHIDPELAYPIIADLDLVDWSTLEHPFGSAEKVPILLRVVLSEDYLASIVAWDDLAHMLLHQGSIGSATVAALPYFLRMVSSTALRLHYMSLSFLSALAWASHPEDLGSSAQSADLGTISDESDLEDATEIQQQYEYLRAIWVTLTAAQPEIHRLAEESIPEIQEVAHRLLARLSNIDT
jgi:hypothetical protein